ncbi:hypothetical protein AB9N12_12165 [Bacteroides sp. AN502(2024)]|uniref:hypothetical protein n=1 Tax=Bacteroides sp. AN502(2024) TaxID=3160599 RepID=UPI0035142A10
MSKEEAILITAFCKCEKDVHDVISKNKSFVECIINGEFEGQSIEKERTYYGKGFLFDSDIIC